MSSDSTKITSADPFAHNSREGLPVEDVIGTFDISSTLEPAFHRGSAGVDFERMTDAPSAPGSERVPANPSANPRGGNLAHHLNREA